MIVMRYLIVALMIALLPVRTWLGDAMAMQLVSGDSFTLKMVAESAHSESAGSTFSLQSTSDLLPCHEGHTAVDTGTQNECSQCSTCQVCHGGVMSVSAQTLPLLALPTQLAQCSRTLFASVHRAPHLKPPIS